MDNHNFEERIKNALAQHRPEADTDAIWKNIEPRLKKKRKRRILLWFFWVLGLVLGALFFRLTTASPAEQAAQHRSGESTVQEKLLVAAPGNITPPASRALAAGQKPTSDPVATAPLVAHYLSTPAINIPEATRPAERAPNDMDSAVQTREAAWMVQPLIPLLPLAVLEWPAVRRDSVPDTSILQELGRYAKERDQINKGKKEEKVADNLPKDEKKPDRRKKSKKRKAPWVYELSAQAGPALAIRQLRERSGVTAATGHLKKRQTTEHTLESFTGGLFYSAAHRGLVLKTGLQYRQSNEKFHLAYFKQETEQINGVVTVTINGAGNTIEQTSGNKTIIKTTEYSNTVYNHYRFINLPVGIGYRQAHKKSRWELSGGMDLNLFFRADGAIYNKYNVLTAFKYGDTVYENMFRQNTGLGVWAAYVGDWRLTDQLRWQLSANVQLPLRPVSSATNALVQRYFNVGVQLGVVYVMEKGK